MDNRNKVGSSGLSDLLELFEEDISIADINASKYLGKISAVIVKKRMELNMTQKEFAKHIEVSQSMVSKWESGDYNFSIKALAEIAEKLDMELHVNLKSHAKITVEQKAKKNQTYIYAASARPNYNLGTKNNIIKFTNRESCIKRIYNSELIEM